MQQAGIITTMIKLQSHIPTYRTIEYIIAVTMLAERRLLSAVDSNKLEQKFRYAHLRPEEFPLVDAILKGKVPFNSLPQAEARVIRLFISSTFTGDVMVFWLGCIFS